MGWWTPLLLHLHLVAGVSLPAPVKVSIDSLNMEHTLSFLPGLGTSADTHFRVQILRFRRRNSWKPVAGCLELAARQTCNLTGEFMEPLQQYQARVQAFTPTQESNWTLTGHFTPYTDTVLGPPKVSVSGCGNCLLLQVSPPTSGSIQQYKQLQDLYSGLLCVVRRTRDGAQFSLNLAYEEEVLIRYLQPGVEYCVTVTVTATINSNSIPTEPHCAFTGPPASSSVHVTLSLLCVFCVLLVLLTAMVVYGGHLTSKLSAQRPPGALSYIPFQGQGDGRAQPEQSNQAPASQTHDDGPADTHHSDVPVLRSSLAVAEGGSGPAAKQCV